MTYQNIQSALVCERTSKEVPESQKNCASAGVQLFQVFSSTSALLGLSRSSDYAAVNANLNTLVNFRRSQGMTSQSNMWGEIKGTGLAGGGTGAAGAHGGGGGVGETVQLQPKEVARQEEDSAKQAAGEYPREYYQRDAARGDLVTVHREMSNPIDIAHKASFSSLQSEGFVLVRGLSVSLRTKEKTDKVLVIANVPASMPENHDGACWTLKRGNYYIGPQFASWTNELGRLDNVLMPWLDEPDKARMELEYTANCRLKGSIKISKEQERRQLTAILIPGGQVTTARSHEPLAVTAGRWHDVPGLQQVSVTNRGEKVLVVCTIKYTAMWSDAMTRGRFSIFRNGTPLDTESYGLQSVRALKSGVKRTLVMAMVDDPEPGPQMYAARAAVTTDAEEQRVCHLDDDDRQLALIRLPADAVDGPSRCAGATSVDEDKWTAIAGLSITTTLKNSSDKVLIVYNVNFNPSELNYETYFTLFRSSSSGGSKNMGQDMQGMWSVASSSVGSCEYPVTMFTDTPGAGTYTYTVYARTRRCDHLAEATPVEVGPEGQISAVHLPSGAAPLRSAAGGADGGSSLLEEMAAEMEGAMGGAMGAAAAGGERA